MDTILIIGDDPRLGPTIRKGRCEQKYNALLAQTSQAARRTVKTEKPDLLVLDLGLPDCDGVVLLHSLRRHGYRGLVLILTARDGLTDKLQGLDAVSEVLDFFETAMEEKKMRLELSALPHLPMPRLAMCNRR